MGKRPLGDIYDFSTEEVKQLLHNKFVVILGDSNYRAIYKDLVHILQDDCLLTLAELQQKGKERFWNDHRVEWDGLKNATNFREVRQYRTDHHLVRLYFITRIYSDYMESVLDDFRAGPTPDLLILNSCLWDLNRYPDHSSREPRAKAFRDYRENLKTLFSKLHAILPTSCLIIWNTTMPIRENVEKAFLEPGMKNNATPRDILLANFESAMLAVCWQFDVLDLNFCFRFFREHQASDGVHWDRWAHRYITQLLLTHVARAWGVHLEKKRPQNGIAWNGNVSQQCLPPYQPPRPRPPPMYHPPPQAPCANGLPFADGLPFTPSHDPRFQHDTFPDYGSFSDWELPACPEEVPYDGFRGPVDSGGPGIPPLFPVDQEPGGGLGPPFPSHMDYVPDGGQRGFPHPPRRSPRGFRGRPHNGRIMRHRRFYGEHYRPYAYPYNGAWGSPSFQAPPYVGWRGW